jgi:hypothetical protein
MFSTILLLIFAFVFYKVVQSRPDTFRITRSITINAPASEIFPHVNDLRKWLPWSPWVKLDPNARNTFEGPTEGKGAKTSWVGNNKVGAGSMLITESRPSELIQLQLDFLKPMKATNTAEFTFTPQGNATQVTWAMFGKNNFFSKIINLIMNCDKMVGSQFEKGLAGIKNIAESRH